MKHLHYTNNDQKLRVHAALDRLGSDDSFRCVVEHMLLPSVAHAEQALLKHIPHTSDDLPVVQGGGQAIAEFIKTFREASGTLARQSAPRGR
jgi:hypothetical protein